MRIHKEGYKIIVITLIIAFFLSALTLLFVPQNLLILKCILIFVIALLTIGVVRFFRVPKRNWIKDNNAVISPADGTVVAIEITEENEYFKDKRIQISIFMSIYNIHLNLFPISGKVVYTKYWDGKYHIARYPKSSKLNEHNTVVVKNDNFGEILVKQIAGFIARRIVSNVKLNQEYKQSDELGFIRFGSRVDIFLPLNSDVKVKLNQKVKAGITIISE